jgi:Response regulators consisting of a CheY-like receiver domain and a winged-helix DNA-binding domain
MRLLLIEDEKHMADAIEVILNTNKYVVDICYDGLVGLDYALSNIYDVILLDIMLPGLDGISIIKELRKEKISTPILLLTAKDDINDKIDGLDNGADDYLTKPFNIDELLARIRALYRRKEKHLDNDILTYKDISLDPLNLKLYSDKNCYNLTLKESQILEMLINNNKTILSKDMIIEKVWGFDNDIPENQVEVYISFLRKKINAISAIVHIKNIRNVGYKLAIKEMKND